MKFNSLIKATLISAIISIASAEKWTFTGEELSAKGASAKIDNGLTLSAIKAGEHLNVRFSDGKQKFGSATIAFKKGNITYKRPRMLLKIPLSNMKKVSKIKPFLVTSFMNGAKEFDLYLTKGTSQTSPDIVIIQK